MSTTARTPSVPGGLVAAVLVMLLLVLGLGGAVVAVKLRPEALPTDPVAREIVAWRDTVSASPDDATAHTGLGLALLKAQQNDEARSEFETAIRLDRKAWMATFQLALLTRDASPDQAAQLLEQAAKYAPETDRVAPLVALGDLAIANKEFDRAASAYRRALVYNPFLFDAHLGLGKALEAQGNDAGALKEYLQAKRFDPTNAEVAAAIRHVRASVGA
jgi:tetratricopeptide (TPR) repeat protein